MKTVLKGLVVSDSSNKTITVKVDRVKRHPIYRKQYKVSRNIAVHDEKNKARRGDTVEIIEATPTSRTKRWNLSKIINRQQRLGEKA